MGPRDFEEWLPLRGKWLTRGLLLLTGTAGTLLLILAMTTLWPPGLMRPSRHAQVLAARTQMTSFAEALAQYAKDNGKPPTTQQGLQALIARPGGGPRPRNWRKYLADITMIPKDTWGSDYVYRAPGRNGESYFLASYGADGSPGGRDFNADLTRVGR
jgi:general secretion pathway protein G